MTIPRILLCITVYNGRRFVPRTLRSATNLRTDGVELDILVLDDHSPEPGWSDEVAALCVELGIGYYCTPRNLGIPRNVNLGLARGVTGGYDYVMICNSDIILPSGVVLGLLDCVRTDDKIGSVTALSNNVSLYSVPNSDPDAYLADQDIVDWVNAGLLGHYGTSVMDIPAGISFCIIIPTPVIRDIGLMDPVFGRGYCEETDFTLRSLRAGYRIGLAPGVFTYHQGGGSNVEAGLVSHGMTTVPANEAIIDLRYPQFRNQVSAFYSSGIMQQMHADVIEKIIHEGGRQFGYRVDIGWAARRAADPRQVTAQVVPEARPEIKLTMLGFEHVIPLRPGDDVAAILQAFFGRAPDSVSINNLDGRSFPWTDPSVPMADRLCYPARV
ncbi:MAG: glycosyltransferase [Nakamurella sp.]